MKARILREILFNGQKESMNTTEKEDAEEYRVKEEKALNKTEQPLDVTV